MMMKKKYLPAIFFTLILMGCSQRNYQDQEKALARVNDRAITMQDFNAQITPMESLQGIDTKSENGKKNVLDNMVFQEMVYQKAIEEGFHLKNLAIKHTVVDQYLKKKFKPSLERIQEESVKKFYTENAGKLDQARAKHILIKIDPDDKDAGPKAKTKIAGILADIKADKISFEEAAKQYSEDGTAEKGGDLGYFTKNMMVGPFSKMAFSLEKPNDISDIVETRFGVHIIKLVDKKVGFEEHRKKIRQHLIKEEIEKETNLYKSELKNGNDVEIFYDRLPKQTKP